MGFSVLGFKVFRVDSVEEFWGLGFEGLGALRLQFLGVYSFFYGLGFLGLLVFRAFKVCGF